MNNSNFAFADPIILEGIADNEQASVIGAATINEILGFGECKAQPKPQKSNKPWFVSRPEIEKCGWTREAMLEASPYKIRTAPDEHWRLLLHTFEEDDVVWTGNPMQTGSPENIRNFQTAAEWSRRTTRPGSCLSASTFKVGSYSRCNDNVVSRRFLVVSGNGRRADDTMVIRWLHEVAKLDLTAVVHNGVSRYWGWFQYPDTNMMGRLMPFFRYWCDGELFSPSQPYPMPGAPYGKHTHEIVWLN